MIGFANQRIGRNPPTLRKFIQHSLFYREKDQSIEQSVSLAIKNAMNIWENMGVPIKRSDHCVEKLMREYGEWKQIMKNKNIKSPTQKFKCEASTKKLDAEFNVRRDPKSETETMVSTESHRAEVEISDIPETEINVASGAIRKNSSGISSCSTAQQYESDGKNTFLLADFSCL